MIPVKLGQRTFPPQEGWADAVLWIQLHGNQNSMKKGNSFWAFFQKRKKSIKSKNTSGII